MMVWGDGTHAGELGEGLVSTGPVTQKTQGMNGIIPGLKEV